MKLFILVKTFSGIIEDVFVTLSEKEAENEFKKYTGTRYGKELHEDYDETKIFVAELEESNENPSSRFRIKRR